MKLSLNLFFIILSCLTQAAFCAEVKMAAAEAVLHESAPSERPGIAQLRERYKKLGLPDILVPYYCIRQAPPKLTKELDEIFKDQDVCDAFKGFGDAEDADLDARIAHLKQFNFKDYGRSLCIWSHERIPDYVFKLDNGETECLGRILCTDVLAAISTQLGLKDLKTNTKFTYVAGHSWMPEELHSIAVAEYVEQKDFDENGVISDFAKLESFCEKDPHFCNILRDIAIGKDNIKRGVLIDTEDERRVHAKNADILLKTYCPALYAQAKKLAETDNSAAAGN